MVIQQKISQRNNPVHSTECYPECECLSSAKNTKRALYVTLSSVREEINCYSINNSQSPTGTDDVRQPAPVTHSLYSQHTAMNLHGDIICDVTKNSDIVFRLKRMGPSSHEDASDERIMVRSRPINSDFQMARDKDEYLILDLEDDCPIQNEFLLLENCNEVSNRTRALFENNRLLPTTLGKDMNDSLKTKSCYRITYSSPES